MQYKVFGCKTNRYFAEKWLVHPHLSEKEGYFIASCVVTDKAKAKWVKHAKKILPGLHENDTLFLSGCWNIRNGEVDPAFYEIYHELSAFREKIEILPEDPEDFRMSKEEKLLAMKTKIRSLGRLKWKELFTRKFLVIQTGCDNFCTFCLTVQARGRHKWRPKEEIIDEIRAFIEDGWKEVVFTGINLGAWGSTTSNNFSESRIVELITAVLQETTLERLRISSLWVEFCSDALIELFKNPRIIAYPHLSIQSGSSNILKAMNRHYDGQKVREVLGKLRSLEREDGLVMNIWADLIVGFPGETDEDFQDTLSLVRDFDISQLHAFAFSPHVDHYSVPAGKFDDQVPNHIAQKRLKLLLAAGNDSFRWLAQKNQNTNHEVLVEKIREGGFTGWTKNYLSAHEANFLPREWSDIRKGSIIIGTLLEAWNVVSDDI
jgi:threonylcarbamoyladenosine tRNA methylthiotransferase MtaB